MSDSDPKPRRASPLTVNSLIALLIGAGVAGPTGSFLGAGGSVAAINEAKVEITAKQVEITAKQTEILRKLDTLSVQVLDHGRRLGLLEQHLREHDKQPAHDRAALQIQDIMRRVLKLEGGR